jgi:hypothetical protein
LTSCTGSAPYPIEPRFIGDGHRIVFKFNRPPNVSFTAQAADADDLPLNGIDWNVPHVVAGSEVFIHMTGIAERQRAQFVLLGPMGVPTFACALAFMAGDITASQRISAADISAAKAHSGNATTQANFRADLNLSGTVNGADVSAVKARSGSALP